MNKMERLDSRGNGVMGVCGINGVAILDDYLNLKKLQENFFFKGLHANVFSSVDEAYKNCFEQFISYCVASRRCIPKVPTVEEFVEKGGVYINNKDVSTQFLVNDLDSVINSRFFGVANCKGFGIVDNLERVVKVMTGKYLDQDSVREFPDLMSAFYWSKSRFLTLVFARSAYCDVPKEIPFDLSINQFYRWSL